MVHIADGDTITVLRDGEDVRIGLYGIDTPESGQPFGNRAERFAEKTIGDNRVEIVPKDKDRYGRTVALVYEAEAVKGVVKQVEALAEEIAA